jgi:hypothetical protein
MIEARFCLPFTRIAPRSDSKRRGQNKASFQRILSVKTGPIPGMIGFYRLIINYWLES